MGATEVIILAKVTAIEANPGGTSLGQFKKLPKIFDDTPVHSGIPFKKGGVGVVAARR